METKTSSWLMRSCAQLLLALATAGSVNAAEPQTEAPVRVGEPVAVENLTIFPMHGAPEQSPIALTTLDAALAKGDAVVSEIGNDARGDGAEVNRLQIQNKGKLPIYVLAGTVVKGGKQ